MHRMLRTAILITFGILIICIIGGCGDDPPEEVTDSPQLEDDVSLSPITVMVDPVDSSEVYILPSGIYIPPYPEFTLTFNEEVVAVTVNGTPATGSRLNWEWSAQQALPYGPVKLNIKWTNRDGSKGFKTVGPYTVIDSSGEPPAITSGTVADGAIDVDPGPINAAGFRYDFDENVIGAIALTDEEGADLHWTGIVVGQTATLTAVAGQELANGTTYKIEIDVQDGAGNSLQATIIFVTKLK